MSGVIRPNFYTVLRHLAFARHWLDKAEGEFRSAQTDRGELTLSLAEAEMREAWEASRRVRSTSLDLLAGAARLWQSGQGQLGTGHRWLKAGALIAAVLTVALVFGNRPTKAPVQPATVTRAAEPVRVAPASVPVSTPNTKAATVDNPVGRTGGGTRGEKTKENREDTQSPGGITTEGAPVGGPAVTNLVALAKAGPVESPQPETLPVKTTVAESPVTVEAQVRPAVKPADAVAVPFVATAAVLSPSEIEITGGVTRSTRLTPVHRASAAPQPVAAAQTADTATAPKDDVAVDLIELVQVAQQSLYKK